MGDLPTGTLTLLFTDIEGSTRLLHELGPERYADVLAEHRRVLRAAFTEHGGVEVDTQGDAFFVAFPSAVGALAAARDGQQALAAGAVRVRMGVHTGTPHRGTEGYVGVDVHRAARIAAVAHGGQVVVSESSRALALEHEFRDLGEHRLKDLSAPEHLWQLGAGDFPPLATLHRTNLPIPPTPFLGREPELAAAAALLVRADVRLVTFTGPGGTGKTRLALQAAAEAAESFPDGITWVPLATLRDARLVAPTVARALELRFEPSVDVREALAQALAGQRCLLLLDNAEHLLPDLAREVSALREIDGPTLLVTSRERLQLQGEHVYAVPTMAEADAAALFTTRARAVGSDLDTEPAVWELCRHLDNLPLALELAAARTVLFSPEELLARLGQRLDLLRGGRDTDPRQQTLRATIAWSYELLDERERRLFARLAVFAGGCDYDAAEAVADANPETLQSLVDKSLVRRRHGAPARFWMLESIREFAAERLEDRPDAEALTRDHSTFYAKVAATRSEELRGASESALAVVDAELANVRAGLRVALERDEAALAGAYLSGMWFYWLTQGLGSEAAEAARAWLELERDTLLPEDRVPGLVGAGEILRVAGDPDAAIELKLELLALARAHPDVQTVGGRIGRWTPAILADLAHLLVDADRAGEATAFAEEALAIRQAAGEPRGLAHAQNAFIAIADGSGDYTRAKELGATAAALFESAGAHDDATWVRAAAAEHELLLGDVGAACLAFADAVTGGRTSRDRLGLGMLLRVAAAIVLEREDPARAALLLAAADRVRSEGGIEMRSRSERQRDERRLARLRALIGADGVAQATAEAAEADAVALLEEVGVWLASVADDLGAPEAKTPV